MVLAGKTTTLWIGGSSGLARTYMNAYGYEGLILAGVEDTRPDWLPHEVPYYTVDLCQEPSAVASLVAQQLPPFQSLLVGVRAPLVLGNNRKHQALLEGIQVLMEAAVVKKKKKNTKTREEEDEKRR